MSRRAPACLNTVYHQSAPVDQDEGTSHSVGAPDGGRTGAICESVRYMISDLTHIEFPVGALGRYRQNPTPRELPSQILLGTLVESAS